jgi:putative NADPH-quinone reductase
MKKILLINAHPKEESLCTALAEQYTAGAKEVRHEIKIINLRDLELSQYINFTHQELPKLSADLIEAQKLITWADHLVFVYPIWWATPPALFKLFFEVIFHTGFAFQYQKSTGMIPKWDKLLPNKSARVLVTMDTPPWYYKLFMGEPGYKMMKNNLLFCGFSSVRKNYFGIVKTSSEKQRQNWLKNAYKIGLKE